jgi:hypothetical protein
VQLRGERTRLCGRRFGRDHPGDPRHEMRVGREERLLVRVVRIAAQPAQRDQVVDLVEDDAMGQSRADRPQPHAGRERDQRAEGADHEGPSDGGFGRSRDHRRTGEGGSLLR